MTFSESLVRSALLGLAGLALSGCLPTAQSQLEEEKEPHYLRGKSRVSELDFRGAIESFEKALEVNPQSASAHFELGCLFENKQLSDPAAAIYHYERYLKLRPNADNAEIVKQQVMACKQELARAVWVGPISEKVQEEIKQLTLDNKRLTEENKQVHAQIDELRAYAAHLQTLTNQVVMAASSSGAATPVPVGINPGGAAVSARSLTYKSTGSSGVQNSDSGQSSQRPVTLSGAVPRTHTVKPGETAFVIARKYGVKLEALLAANPRLEPRRMRPGQSLTIPPP